MLLVLHIFGIFLFDFVRAETGDAYHGPPQARELFSYNDRLFYFYSDRVPYDEAAAICQAGDMHLTHLDDPGKAKFAAESIAEAWMVFEDMWIGAKKQEMGRWVWEWNNKRIPEESQMMQNYTYMYPPWIDNEIPARDGKDCLAVDRNGHNDPFFVDLDCKLPRPFICEQNVKQNRTDPYISSKTEVFDIEFILYHGRLSWSAAVSFCRQQGFALATVENMTVARKLAKAMLKSRPEFEDAWIGANLKDDKWVWVETGEDVKSIPGEYRDPTKGETPENIITPQFPPWFEAEPRKGRECVIFDRHLCDEPKFIDLKCNRQRDFICIKREQATVDMQILHIVDRDRKRYIFFPVSATWYEAKRICDEEGESTTMLNLSDIDETKFIMQTMSDARRPIDHLWLGGKIIENKWHWVGRDEETERKPIEMIPDETGFPPWCDNETNLEMACLNLDRQNHWTPLIYGLECNSTQAVVCVQPVEPNDRIIDYKGPGGDDPEVKLRVTKLVQNPLSWDQAEKVCEIEVGRLWKPRFDKPESEEAIKTLFNELKEGQSKDIESGVYHVNGGHYDANKNAWIVHDKAVTITTGWEPEHGDCLVGQINSSATEWTWFPVKCYHKLYSQVICVPRCSLSEVNYEEENSEWICDAASSNIFDHKMIGMGCTHRCNESLVTQGPDRFTCDTKGGWLTPQESIPVKSGLCKPPEKALDVFEHIPSATATLGFILDSTSDSPKDYNASKYLIGNLIDFYRSKMNELNMAIISIEPDQNGAEAAVLKYRNSISKDQECDNISAALDLLVDRGEGVRDYGAGLGKMKDVLGDSILNEAHIVFIVPETNQKGIFKQRAHDLNQDARVFAIGTNKHTPMNQLVDIASMSDGISFALRFNKPPHLVKAVQALMKECTECKCATAFDNLVKSMLEEPGGQADHVPEPTNPPE
ncbi:hypothetical protein ILUMI_10443 [Ignelater luminosus]|uniref:C-type lectin domain-containing protein n=1 Tax=Ignelater luminosus TaxID=2038154 RepID=A0A8K0GDM6_IGNLU|nr:hypothetical protein ILUMI_10443 [Ignelater luminosus]